MSILSPMTPEDFDHYRIEAVQTYAEQNVKSGRWPAAEAVERSETEHRRLLPQGRDTLDNHFFNILDTQSKSVVGSLCFGILQRSGSRDAFVFDVRVLESHRRRGHARRALEALEPIVRELGLSSIGLHVFAYNVNAQSLYESLGYGVTSLNMHKHLVYERDA